MQGDAGGKTLSVKDVGESCGGFGKAFCGVRRWSGGSVGSTPAREGARDGGPDQGGRSVASVTW